MLWHPKNIQFPYLPKPLKTQLFTLFSYVFFNFSMCQCRWPTQTYIHKILQKHCFFSVFIMFSVKNAIIYTFFGIKSVQNRFFFAVFSMLWHPTKIAIYSVFSFLTVFPLPEAYQNDPKFHFNTLLSSDTQKSSKNLANTT